MLQNIFSFPKLLSLHKSKAKQSLQTGIPSIFFRKFRYKYYYGFAFKAVK